MMSGNDSFRIIPKQRRYSPSPYYCHPASPRYMFVRLLDGVYAPFESHLLPIHINPLSLATYSIQYQNPPAIQLFFITISNAKQIECG